MAVPSSPWPRRRMEGMVQRMGRDLGERNLSLKRAGRKVRDELMC